MEQTQKNEVRKLSHMTVLDGIRQGPKFSNGTQWVIPANNSKQITFYFIFIHSFVLFHLTQSYDLFLPTLFFL